MDDENIEVEVEEDEQVDLNFSEDEQVNLDFSEDIVEAVSPKAIVTKTGDTATITITDIDGTTTASISDGAQGAQGETGETGNGIESVQINSSGHLLVTYTNGYIVDAGAVGDANIDVSGNSEPGAGYLQITYNGASYKTPLIINNSLENNLIRSYYLPEATTSAKGAMSATDKVKLNAIIPTVLLASGSSTITASCTGYSLNTGTLICVRFQNGVAANATLNINDTGAKNIYHDVSSRIDSKNALNAGEVAILVYRTASGGLPEGYEIIARANSATRFNTFKDGLTPKAPTPSETGDEFLLSSSGWVSYPAMYGGLPEPNVKSDWNQSDVTKDDYIWNKPVVPSKTSDLTNDSGFITSSSVPTKTSDLTNDSGFITTETDPTVPSWAKQSSKPTYTASEVGAAPTSHASPYLTYGAANATNYGHVALSDLVTSGSDSDTPVAATPKAVKTAYDLANSKQDALVSGTNIKTINNTSLLGSGNIDIAPTVATVTLSTSGWDQTNFTKSVTVTGITASSIVVVSPDPDYYSDYTDANIRCTGQAANSLTFKADKIPTNSVDVNAMWW